MRGVHLYTLPDFIRKMEDWTAYGVEYQAVYDSYTTKPSDAQAAIDNTMVEGWVSDGVLAKLDILDIGAVHINSDSEALKNWISPGTFDPSLVNAPAFGINEGFTGNGANAYINLNWNPSVNGVNYIQDSASVGIYIRTNVGENRYDIGCNDGIVHVGIQAKNGSNKGAVKVNSSLLQSAANTDSRGMFIANRVLSTEQDLWKNKVRIVNGTRGTNGVPNMGIVALANNANGSIGQFSTKQLSMVFAGSGLTQTDINNLTDRFETRMDALGKGVIT